MKWIIDCFTHVFAALRRVLCYSAMMMHARFASIATIFCCCLLVACGSPQKKSDVLDLYQLPSTGQGVRPAAIDNDSYYSQPGGLKSCSSINEGPSCGGG